MVRQWWWDVYAAWLTVFVPLAVASCLLLPPVWAFVLVWWLNPATERVVLHVVASAVFGSRPRLRDTLRSFFSYARNGLIRSLLPSFRFSPPCVRSARPAARERARAPHRLRSKQLHRRVINQASWLTIVCLLFEAVVFFSLVGLYDLLVPAASQESFNAFEVFQATPDSARDYVVTALFLTALAMIEPLYVAGGFALYLNRRTALEGWDLEVQLRRIAQRTDRCQAGEFAACGPAVVVAFVPAIGLSAVLGLPGRAPAQDVSPPSREAQASQIPESGSLAPTRKPGVPPGSDAKRQILEVLKDSQFQQFETQTLIEPLQKKTEEEKAQWDTSGLGSIMRLIAKILRWVMWVLVGGVLVYALYWVLQAELDPAPERSQWMPPQTLFGLDVRPSLPQDVAAVAAQLARSGNLVRHFPALSRHARDPVASRSNRARER